LSARQTHIFFIIPKKQQDVKRLTKKYFSFFAISTYEKNEKASKEKKLTIL